MDMDFVLQLSIMYLLLCFVLLSVVNALNATNKLTCFGPGQPGVHPANMVYCLGALDFVIKRDGAQEFVERQPFYYGNKKYPRVHQTPDQWSIGERGDSCAIRLTVDPPPGPATEYEAKDVFTLADVATVAQDLINECLQSSKSGLGGRGEVGNDRGFIVTLNGLPALKRIPMETHNQTM